MRMLRMCLLILTVFSALTTIAAEKGIVTSMKKVKCGAPVAKFSVMEALAGPNMISADLSCLEFTLRTTNVQYRLRPKRQMLLPVGSNVSVRVDKKHVMVQVEDSKQVQCEVVSMDLLDENGEPVEPREMQGFPMPPMSQSYVQSRPTPRVMPRPEKRNCLTLEGDVVPCGG